MNDSVEDNWFEIPKVDGLIDLFKIGCSTAVIFGGLVPYIPQYLKIKRSKSSDGFSTYVCLTLLISNILRIMFWFGHRFELPLLIQSFVMIAGMLSMMEMCIRMRDKRSLVSSIGFGYGLRQSSAMDMRSTYNFWNWDNIIEYVQFLCIFILSIGLLTYVMIDKLPIR